MLAFYIFLGVVIIGVFGYILMLCKESRNVLTVVYKGKKYYVETNIKNTGKGNLKLYSCEISTETRTVIAKRESTVIVTGFDVGTFTNLIKYKLVWI